MYFCKSQRSEQNVSSDVMNLNTRYVTVLHYIVVLLSKPLAVGLRWNSSLLYYTVLLFCLPALFLDYLYLGVLASHVL